jgi:hypothetical protein
VSNGFGQLIPTDVQARFRFANSFPGGAAPANVQLPASPLPGVAADAENFFKNWGGKSLAQPNAPVFDSGIPPWVQPPAGAQPFLPVGVLPTPAADGNDYLIQSFQVPIGWDGVINAIGQIFGGPGNILGTGYLTWRLFQSGKPVKNFESVQVPYGYLTTNQSVVPLQLPAGIQVFGGDVISHFVRNDPASTLPVGSTSILSMIAGYFWPRMQQ